jgi:hypothetical protein
MELRKIFRNQMEVRIDRVGTDQMRQKTLCSIGNSIGMLDGRKLLPVRKPTITRPAGWGRVQPEREMAEL